MIRYANTIHTIAQLDLFDDLAVGFRTFKQRGDKVKTFFVAFKAD
jgi:hypothetical protein